jgi:hypothetical protein
MTDSPCLLKNYSIHGDVYSNPHRHCRIIKAGVSQTGFCRALGFHISLLRVPNEIKE